VERLAAHDWPGNIRELKNAVERLLILASGGTVKVADVERLVGKERDGGRERAEAFEEVDASWLRSGTFEQFKQAAEKVFIETKLREYDWNISETARVLDMPRSNLYKKMERYGLVRRGEG
jgi:two-component system nitrogen regulation response regulator NtrX